MIAWTLAEVAAAVGGTRHGADAAFTGVSTDTRTLAPGQLYVALKGPNFDGHAFLTRARECGAAAALQSAAPVAGLPCVQVADTRAALGALAAAWRARFVLPVVGVTGSNGKTTVKEMLAAMFAAAGPALATAGNLNNDIGVPLTLFGLGGEHRYAVIEMGANPPGEIAALAGLARPTAAVVTNAAPAHLEGFGTLEGVARAKGELFSALPGDGLAVYNLDDEFAPLWRELIGNRRAVSFSVHGQGDVHAMPASLRIEFEPETRMAFELMTPRGRYTLRTTLLGAHNVSNAVAAAAVALGVGLDVEHVYKGLLALRPLPGRMFPITLRRGVTVVDDTYNANPASLDAALRVLREMPGRRILVLGDMGELGDAAADWHATAGDRARLLDVDEVYTVGAFSRLAGERFGPGGVHFPHKDALLAALRERLDGAGHLPLSILVKGSRRAGMEQIVAALTPAEEP